MIRAVFAGLCVVVWFLIVLMLVAGCTTMPRIRAGWVDVAPVGNACEWEQRPYAARLRCAL